VLLIVSHFIYAVPVNPTRNARRLRREQTDKEKELWRALRAGRFAGFKFRRQHPLGDYFLDFYCPVAKLSIELDGFQHGLPEQRQHDEEREKFLEAKGIEKLRFWNHQWRANREAVLLEIWKALHRRTGCVAVMRKAKNHRFLPPKVSELIQPPPKPD
jgi:ATP-dependent helicase HrpA/adenine-specific DNA-methyltransferase